MSRTAEAGTQQHQQRWLARAAFVFLGASVLWLVGSALTSHLRLLVEVVVCVVLLVAAAYLFLAHRGLLRLLALVVLLATPVVLVVSLVDAGLLVPLLLGLVLLALAFACGRAALGGPGGQPVTPEHVVPRPRRPFLVMNPRSGGGKVGRFGLPERAARLGAEVVLLEDGMDAAALARDAVARGADLLGVAGGDGTQALVAGVAAELGVPFLVISAGTRNHFALDLGLDRDDPSSCLDALTDDAVELHVDLGVVAGRTFVNNASFGAYAAVVQSPAYRDDKARTTLALLPDLLSRGTAPRLTVQADGITVEHPQAVLVSDNPYGTGDVAGMGRRTRLDAGRLGVVVVTVDSAAQAVGLLRRTRDRGLTVLTAAEVVVSADTPEIPVGVDGEALVLPTPVRCAIRPQALRVRVPRTRPGVPSHRPRWSWVRLRRLAAFPSPRRR